MTATVDERPRTLPVHAQSRPEHVHSQVAPAGTGVRQPVSLQSTLIRAGIVLLATAAAIWAVYAFGRRYTFFDMRIYHGAVVWWAHGGDLYAFVSPGTTLGFTYPPFAALLMAPMSILPAIAAGWVNLLISMAALVLLLTWLLVPIADRYGWPRRFSVALAVPLAAATEPVRETLGFGQINLLLAVLIYADYMMLRNRAAVDTPEPPEWCPRFLARLWASRMWSGGALAGVGVGLATAIKLTPGLFIAYFVVTKQWRAVVVSTGTAIGATVLAFLFAGQDTVTFFTSTLFDTTRVGEVDTTANQSLAGVLARLYDSTTTPTLMWLAFATLLLAVGLTRGMNAHNEGDELAAFTIVGLTANAICPISWTHHLVFLIPALVILLDTALRRRRATRALVATRGAFVRTAVGIPALAGVRHAIAALGVYVLFVTSPIWMYEHRLAKGVSHYADGLHGAVAENSLAIAIIALVALLPWRTGAAPAFYPEAQDARRIRSAVSR